MDNREEIFNITVKLLRNSHNINQEIIQEQKHLLIYLKAEPINGEANKQLIKLLKKYFKAKDVVIIKGEKIKKKIVKIIFN